MNQAEISSSWTGRRWAFAVVLLFAAQIGLVFWLSTRRASHAATDSGTTTLRWIPEQVSTRSVVGARNDPTLFALPTPNGFSGEAWLTVVPFSYHMTNVPTPPHWLLPPVDELADDFNEFVQTNLVAEETLPDQLMPTPAFVNMPLPEVIASTLLKVEGPLAERPLLPGQPLPQLSQPILENSVVRVRVDPSGRVISAVLLSAAGSGSSPADQEALKFAKGARFAPAKRVGLSGNASPTGLISGDLVFWWSRVRWGQPTMHTARR
jgi:TonB family protein